MLIPLARQGRCAAVVALVACAVQLPARTCGASPVISAEYGLPPEIEDDPPGVPAPEVPGIRAMSVAFGRFTSFQVNVNVLGGNTSGDAANEPSIAVDPTNHDRMAIGWRQFDTIASNFREAGYGYTTDGGLTWHRGTIENNVFRSDPVLGYDSQGRFFYNSLTTPNNIFSTRVFLSTNGGANWGTPVFAYGGDKQWMVIDRFGGAADGNVYQAWSTAANQFPPNTFNRSVSDGATYQQPVFIPESPVWGTLDVAPNGTVYVAGRSPVTTAFHVARSADAQNPAATPTFTTVTPNLGGEIVTGGPNPVGLLGQAWIAVDPSPGPRQGWVYVLSSVQTPTDPLDVNFIRSTDGGQTWSAPLRVNDDAPGNRAFQWFGTMSVSPDGRIDAVWNDTRGSADSTVSALYYAFSTDGGSTWSANEQASPEWNSTLGWPNQQKIGDYYHMISDEDGADLAWAATFNGEQDVYYLRIPRATTAVGDGPAPGLRLHGGVPNPFMGSTTIHFDLPAAGSRVKLEVFDAGGRRVAVLRDGFVGGGTRSARWNGTDDAGNAVSAGLYLCRLEAAGVVRTGKLMLLR